MKICPTCRQTYQDESLNYCLIDGATLVPEITAPNAAAPPTIHSLTNKKTDEYTNAPPNLIPPTAPNAALSAAPKSGNLLWIALILGAVVLLCGGGLAGLLVYLSTGKNSPANYNSPIAVKDKKGESNFNASVPNISVKPPIMTNSNAVGANDTDDPALTGLTMAKYLRLEPDMTYQEAVKVLGGEGAELSNSKSGNIKVVMYKWDNNDSEFITAMFINDKLNMRSQAGLSKRLSPTLTLEKFNQVKKGMTYQEAAAILGEGDEQGFSTVAGIKFITYHWQVDKLSYIALSFTDGKLNSKSQSGLK